MVEIAIPTEFDIPSILDDRGALAVLEYPSLPFEIKRLYFLYDLRAGSTRGSHAHKNLSQIFIAVSGALTITLDDGKETPSSWRLHSPTKALLLPPGYWRTLSGFAEGTVCLVLASFPYDPEDYIRNYEEFLAWKHLE